MSQNVLVIGGGGREHAICWKLSQSPKVKQIFVTPGSHAISQVNKVTNINLDIKNFKTLVEWSKTNNIHLVVVGPEDPLANGIADAFTAVGIACFGPGKTGAQIEANKDWAKAFMDRHQVPTARWGSFTNADEAKNYINTANFQALVVKASGLAAGKGVVVAPNKEAACMAVDEILTTKKFGTAGDVVVVEELLEGEEVSVLAFCDGKTVKAMLPAQDHKRIFEGDMGPNTGGMGAYCPCPLVDEKQLNYVQKEVLERTVEGLQKENIKFVGVLYAGLMMTKQGPKVLEFNCRFGDPETEVLLPMLESDLYDIMAACCNGTLHKQNLKWKTDVSAVGVVMASRGYPETSSKGQEITGLEKIAMQPNYVIFHCGTAYKEDTYVTNGGRVLIVVALAPQLAIAAGRATRSCGEIQFDGAQFRKDIAHKGISRSILQSGKLTYKASGVDIVAGDSLVSHIKPAARSTTRTGVMGGLGGFGGLFDMKAAGFKDPILVSGTDGVGTKLKIAQICNIHDTIGIDLVAMCVNDVLAHGAEPLFFLDYFACGALDVQVAKNVVSGVAEGCRQSGCSLIGGETAEMPSMYPPGEYDVAGFAVGAVERNQMIPQIESIQDGDGIIALPSSGVHSNGFSLVRRVMLQAGVEYTSRAPFSTSQKSFGEELLTPTKIYVKPVLQAVRTGHVKAFAHITGGGLTENIPRVLPNSLGVELDARKWHIPAVFGWLAAMGGISESEMLRTFNCGIGGILVVPEKAEKDILKLLASEGASVIGKIKKIIADQRQVNVRNFADAMDPIMRRYVPKLVSKSAPKRKRVAVLISGSGTNLQSLIDSSRDPTKHIGAEIVLVISNKSDVYGLKRAEQAGIPTKVLKHTDYKTREEFDQKMHQELLNAGVEIVCLAGFMRILSEAFVREWTGRILNIHPSLLPAFKGTTHAQRDALEAGVRITGCTVHFVEPDVDGGAIIVQESVPVYINDTVDILVERIKAAEHQAFPKALKLVASGQVTLGPNNQAVWN